MVTYDILIISILLALIVGVWIGLLISTYIFEKPIEKSKAKKPKVLSLILGGELYKCPNCKGLLSQEYKYCHKCGQKLDFGSESK